MAERSPGWHWREGDPPGTVRAWDGATWIGEPHKLQPRPLKGLALGVQVSLAATAVLEVLLAIVWAGEVARLVDGRDGDFDPVHDVARAAEAVERLDALGTILWPVSLGAALLFLVWFDRAYSNVRWLRGSTRAGRVGAILGWVLPPVNLFAPFGLMREVRASDVWTASHPEHAVSDRLLGVWWALFITTVVGAVALALVEEEVTSVDGFIGTSGATAATHIASAIAAGFAVRIVRLVSASQDTALADQGFTN